MTSRKAILFRRTLAAAVLCATLRADAERRAGVVRKAIEDPMDERYNWLILSETNGFVSVAVPRADLPIADARQLVDREVEITGEEVRPAGWMHGHVPRFAILGPQDIRLLRPNRPAFADLHRQTVTGVVLAVSQDEFYLRKPRSQCIRVRPSVGERMPRAGTTVAVTAFTEPDAFYSMLDEAKVIPLPSTPTAFPPLQLMPGSLFEGAPGARTLHSPYHGRIVTVTGRLVRTSDESPAARLAWLDDGENTFLIDESGLLRPVLNGCATGSTLRLTGLLFAEFTQRATPGLLPEFRHFTLIPRTAADFEVLEDPPWWTPQKLLTVIALLVLAFAALVLRNRIQLTQSRIKTEERTRLAIELHDSLSQTLTSVANLLDTAAKGVPDGSPSGRLLLTARQILASCRKELQSCLWDLRSRTFAERTVGEAVARAVEPVISNAALHVRFNLSCRDVSESVLHTIIKVARELVANAVNHGRATRIALAGERQGDRIRFSVADNGCGFDPAKPVGPHEGHFGLQGVRERLAPYDGTVTFLPQPNGGMKARVELNLQEEA